jgi:hypothetical protein
MKDLSTFKMHNRKLCHIILQSSFIHVNNPQTLEWDQIIPKITFHKSSWKAILLLCAGEEFQTLHVCHCTIYDIVYSSMSVA